MQELRPRRQEQKQQKPTPMKKPPPPPGELPLKEPIRWAPKTRAGRISKPPQRFAYTATQGFDYSNEQAKVKEQSKATMVSALTAEWSNKTTRQREATYHLLQGADYDAGTIETDNPLDLLLFAASKADPNTFKWHEAMRQPDWEGFMAAAAKEVKELEEHQTWKLIPRKLAQKLGKKVLDGTWVFRCKPLPDVTIKKLKARYCVRGDQQVAGIDYFETYAPVVNWSTVRLLLVLSIIEGLQSVQVDYNNAFAQATLDEDIFVEIPKGFEPKEGPPDQVLKLQKTLYGLVQAPRAFYEHLGKNLSKRGFRPSEHDPCLWLHEDMVCLVYVDDCIFSAKDKSKIDVMLKDLSKDLELTIEGDVSAFLGIQIEKTAGGFKLTQPGLIKRVIEATGLQDANPDHTPAANVPLGTDTEGELCNEDWEYASVVGMLMFLAQNSRPDIAFATHQCARFTHAPKASHAKAVKRIVRYLKGTSDKGIIMKPSGDLGVDCYVDADFAGLYGVEDSQDPICAKSRTGYVITLSDCPLMWASKMQSEISVATMEAEYCALSTSIRDLIPLRRLVREVCTALLGERAQKARMFSKVFEDNNGALALARAPSLTPRSKHYAIKYHFFKEYVRKGEIKLFKIETEKQLADIFTKGLVKDTFVKIRKLLMGW